MKKIGVIINLSFVIILLSSCVQRTSDIDNPVVPSNNTNENIIISSPSIEGEDMIQRAYFIDPEEVLSQKREMAIDILASKLNNTQLSFVFHDTQLINGKEAIEVRAFYDHPDHIETEGFYYVILDTDEVYKDNLFGEEYILVE